MSIVSEATPKGKYKKRNFQAIVNEDMCMCMHTWRWLVVGTEPPTLPFAASCHLCQKRHLRGSTKGESEFKDVKDDLWRCSSPSYR